MGLRDHLRAVFVEALRPDVGVEVETLRYRDIPQWDSIGHMSLVAAIEDAFRVELETDQVIDMSSFEAAETMLRDLGATE
ncbi:acyl carrier protein [Dactylosporangium matsuzakiense]|uniref:Acyl carrier protein n=1 Tax=Dactylosporangium matsuzakiense TaxID=53360 RepID=A0A9W6NMF5_9ACTN|nr:acyl carrier protein [Dactylosporangium matsuzakiense]GLL02113.1 acyl carrier protein [Dactylosporangium matsuzakiense]